MHLKWIARHAASSERCRKLIQARGRAFNGHALWAKAEDDLVRSCYPDCEKLRRVLKHRTWFAIKGRIRYLGCGRKLHVWTHADVLKLRRVVKNAHSMTEVKDAFPNLRFHQVYGKVRALKLYLQPKDYRPTGSALLDSIHARAKSLNLSLLDVDDLSKTGRYIGRRHWRNAKSPDGRALFKAVEALDGEVVVTWLDP